MNVSKNEIFISYAWGGESERIADKIDEAFKKKGINLIRDKRNLGFKGSIKEFMERIGRGNCVIVIISDEYLRSENCMFELVEIAEKQNFHDRIFPIVLQDANIYKAVNRIKYIKYWEDQISELDSAMKTVSAANLQGITDDINLYTRIRATISGLANTLKDMNTLTAEIHEDSDFRQLIEALEKRTKTSLKTSKPEMTTNTGKWGRVFGKWTHIQDGSIYVGPEDPNTSHPYGILLSDTSMREGVIQVKIRFPQLHGAGRILFGYRSSTNPYFTVGIGGYGYAYVLDDFRPTVGWQAFKYSGIETDIIIGADYQIEVQVKESLIVLKSNGIEIIKGEPPRGIGLGQIGLFAWSTGKVEFRDFRTSFT